MKIFSVSLITFISLLILPAVSQASTCSPLTVSQGGSIQTAIDNASAGATICIGIGTYNEAITLKDDITLEGEELARTIIDGGATGTAVTISDSSNITVRNLTITNAVTGVSALNVSSFTIQNVIITDHATGIECDNTIVTVENTVIDNNTTGIDCNNLSDAAITNTIISDNTTDITSDQFINSGSDYNLLYNNTTSNYPTTDPNSVYNLDPLFVDITSNDYHLESGSPAFNAGTGSDPDGSQADIGAYGGPDMDVIPFPVSGLSATETAPDTIEVDWSTNDAYNINGYNIYYDSDFSGEPYANKMDAGATKPFSLTGLAITPAPPAAVSTQPGNQKLQISWSAVSGATGYIVSYGTSSGIYPNSIDVGNSLSTIIENLTNGTTYYIVVKAYSQPTYYISVSAYDNNTPANESKLVNETSHTLSQRTEGNNSNEATGVPEETVRFPNLENENKCFIATAAYGSSMGPQVVLLREFRNRYLLTNSIGKRFVNIYYSTSPPIADSIRKNAWLKPIVRVVLLPFVGLATYCVELSTQQQYLILFAIVVLLTMLLAYRRRKHA